jgi:hypothetical protein
MLLKPLKPKQRASCGSGGRGKGAATTDAGGKLVKQKVILRVPIQFPVDEA